MSIAGWNLEITEQGIDVSCAVLLGVAVSCLSQEEYMLVNLKVYLKDGIATILKGVNLQ
jgi:hypothetical protein